ncbi:amino acid adenylation domain-containing protein, partial [Streptomyces sp. NPDC057499]|uniref:amino acid adenylation domain-containing protein n=1 Tax=Streptomyces sp. NPDC057499 TaxID=3346150 RepID=UPI0036C61117
MFEHEQSMTSVVDAFARWVVSAPGAVAVRCGGRSLSYAELDAASDRLACALVERGVGAESRVGLLLERSADVVVAMLAVLKAGGAYVPVHASYPEERLRQVLAQAGVCVVLTDRDVSEVGGVSALAVGSAPSGVVALPGWVPAQSLAYVMFTSGSTGVPKGVAVTHDDIVALAADGRWRSGAHGSVLFHSPHSFDAATYEVWVPLLNGGTVVVAGAELSASVVRDAVASGVSSVFMTKALFDLLAGEDPGCFAGLGEVWTGGEAASGAAMGRMLEHCPDTRLVHVYGPTETTTFAVCGALDSTDTAAATVPLGTAMDDTTAYVLDTSLRQVGVGVTGELYLGGSGLARGYDGRADLTAERFVADPFGRGGRLYRTGDLVRWREDGRLEFLGRGDGQVKIRGFRIEVAEVEAVLARHTSVGRVSVQVREDRPGVKRLVAYLVAADGGDLDSGAVRVHASALLPEYMVPSAFVVLDELPLTVNGKVDRKALPAPASEAAEEYVAPRTAAEETLAGIWADVLGLEQVGVHDDFFALGGDSIAALRAIGRVRAALGGDLSSRTLFDHPTVERLATALAPSSGAGTPGGNAEPVITRADRDGLLPLSPGQERLAFLADFAPDDTSYNTGLALRIAGDLDHRALRTALTGLVARHEALRTTFDGHHQHVHDDIPVPVRTADLTAEPAATRDETLRRILQDEQAVPFDLSRGPLVRVLTVRLGPDEHVLALSLHHIVTDGWSMGVMVRELGALYTAALRGEQPKLPEITLDYADFATWQRARSESGVYEEGVRHWREALAGLEPLELPTDRPRPAVRTSAGALHTFEIPAVLADRLKAAGRERGASLFMALTAVTQLLLSRYTGRQDIAVGTVTSGRERPELADLVGFFVNTLVLRTHVDEAQGFGALLSAVRETTLDAFAHQDVPFDRVVDAVEPERDPSRSPLFQALVVLQNSLGLDGSFAGLPARRTHVPRTAAKFDLSWEFWEEQGGGLAAELEYNTDLFDAVTVERMCRHWLFLAGVVAAAPEESLSRVVLLDSRERDLALGEWAGPGVGSGGRSVVELVAERVGVVPGAVAVVCGDVSLTYGELWARVEVLAGRLVALGVGVESRVGVSLPRSADLVVAVLAVLRAGGAYVPL